MNADLAFDFGTDGPSRGRPGAGACKNRPHFTGFSGSLLESAASMLGDLGRAFRTLLKNPGFALVGVITLALGIGANAAMFAVVNAVLLKPLPFRDPDRLMLVHLLAPDRELGTEREMVWSYPKYRTFLDMQETFENTALFAGRDLTLSGDGGPEHVRGEVVTDRYPGILGVVPQLGRTFTGAEAHRPGEAAVAMISHALWTRRYGADPSILGRTIQINARSFAVVGILPAGFRGLTGEAEVWVPFAVHEPSFLTQRAAHGYYLVARRKPAVSEVDAAAAVRVLGVRIADEYAATSWGATARSMYSARIDSDLRRASLVLMGAVGLLLLIACVNLTNLLIARALSRRREVAVRVALGASRMQIARQFLTESLVLACLGSVAGIVMATVLINIGTALMPDADVFFGSSLSPGSRRIAGAAGLTRIGASLIRVDVPTLLFTCVMAAIASAAIALIPALQASALRPVEAMKTGGGRGTSEGFQNLGTRGVLVAAQMTLALVLLVGAGLMMKSAARLHNTSIGVNTERVMTARVDLPTGSAAGFSGTVVSSMAGYNPERRRQFFSQFVDRIRALPGVEAAGLADCAPLSGRCSSTIIGFEPGKHRARPDMPGIGVIWATPEYFPAAGVQLRRGRLFTNDDRAGAPKVVVVNEAAARAFWPGGDPIGKRITLGGGGFEDGAEVIGVVADVRYSALETAAGPDAYIPFQQSPPSHMRVFVHSRLQPATLVTAMRNELRQLDPNLPLIEIRTMDERIGDAMWRTRVASWLLSSFAGLALLLTSIGVFGVMAQTVTQRIPEIGVRMALGAQTHDVLRMILVRAAVLAAVGLALGVTLALGLTRVMSSLLYDVQPDDPATFIGGALVLASVAGLACYLPARRATRVDPILALRYE
jgi:putative ABC transport system permease protein